MENLLYLGVPILKHITVIFDKVAEHSSEHCYNSYKHFILMS